MLITCDVRLDERMIGLSTQSSPASDRRISAAMPVLVGTFTQKELRLRSHTDHMLDAGLSREPPCRPRACHGPHQVGAANRRRRWTQS